MSLAMLEYVCEAREEGGWVELCLGLTLGCLPSTAPYPSGNIALFEQIAFFEKESLLNCKGRKTTVCEMKKMVGGKGSSLSCLL